VGRVPFLSRKRHTEQNFWDHTIPENALMSELTPNPPPVAGLVEYVSKLIVDARRQTAAAVNFGLTALTGELARESSRRCCGVSAVGMGSRLS